MEPFRVFLFKYQKIYFSAKLYLKVRKMLCSSGVICKLFCSVHVNDFFLIVIKISNLPLITLWQFKPKKQQSESSNHSFRSTPCPNVKSGDEWGDPAACESGDACQYCHTRTEQQFHPEIYKSTKCNDIQNTGYCPRGAFCAFAHVDRKSYFLIENLTVFDVKS
jgi:hypothetical protein